ALKLAMLPSSLFWVPPASAIPDARNPSLRLAVFCFRVLPLEPVAPPSSIPPASLSLATFLDNMLPLESSREMPTPVADMCSPECITVFDETVLESHEFRSMPLERGNRTELPAIVFWLACSS